MGIEYKGYGGGKVTVEGDSLCIKQVFIKESCTINDIISIKIIEPTFMKNGKLIIKTNQFLHTIIFLKKSTQSFLDLYFLIQQKNPNATMEEEKTLSSVAVKKIKRKDTKDKFERLMAYDTSFIHQDTNQSLPNTNDRGSWEKMLNDSKYQRLNKRHYDLIEEIEVKYSVLYNLNILDSPKIREVINLCLEDIKMAPQLITYWEYYQLGVPISYPSFKRLAIIYEKQNNYKQGIDVCAEAIRLGFANDGSKGQMYGRLARLIRKSDVQVSQDIIDLSLPK